MLKLRLKKVLIEILRFVLAILPLVVYLIIQREKYFSGDGKGWSCFVYIGMLIVVVALKDTLAELLKKNALLKIGLAMLVFSYFFKYVANEMVWFSIMASIGGALAIIPDLMSREIGKDIDAKRNGEAMAQAFTEEQLKVVKK